MTRTTGATVTFAVNGGLGTRLTATATCASGTALSGGGNVTNNNAKHYAALTSSYPSSATTWTAIATVLAGTMKSGSPASLQAYVVCG